MAIHPLHLAIGQLLREAASGVEHAEAVLDKACGGSQNIPLFVSAAKSRNTRFCCVDGAILRSGRIRVIVEIEESGFLPTKVFGKFLTSALSNGYIHKNHGNTFLPMGAHVLFLQVLDTADLPRGSSKREQWENLGRAIQGLLPSPGLAVSQYELIVGGLRDFEDGGVSAKALVDVVRKALLAASVEPAV